MPVTDTFVPDPPSFEHAQAPRGAANANLPPDESVWAAARRSYVEDGCTSEVVAERHRLSARTVRDHAQKEDWRGMRHRHRAALRHVEQELAPEDPAEALIAEQRELRRLGLLMAPSADAMMPFAADELRDAIARHAPAEARQWSRLFGEMRRDAEVLNRAFQGGLDANDRTRLAYYRSLLLEPELDGASPVPSEQPPD